MTATKGRRAPPPHVAASPQVAPPLRVRIGGLLFAAITLAAAGFLIADIFTGGNAVADNVARAIAATVMLALGLAMAALAVAPGAVQRLLRR